MHAAFYISAAVALVATLLMITRLNAVDALLYLVVSLLAVAVVFFTLGAPFIAALEVIIYAGAIMVLFVFVLMMLNLGAQATEAERRVLSPRSWPGPLVLSAVLLVELGYLVLGPVDGQPLAQVSTPKQVAMSLFGPYALGVELASLLLLSALVGAFHQGVVPRAAPARGGR
ncbi:MAG: NADH-quinone oxidoreductase subunit J [Myxococcaceae bacterium]